MNLLRDTFCGGKVSVHALPSNSWALNFQNEGTIMKKSSIFAALVLGFTGALAAVPALASSALYTTLGPGGTYSSDNLLGFGWTNGDVLGVPFILSSGATVGDVELALVDDNSAAPGNNTVSAYIESDNGGEPASVLASLTQVGTIPLITNVSSGGLITFTCSGGGCDLGAGLYWLVAVQPDTNTLDAWFEAYGDPQSSVAYGKNSSDTGPWAVETDHTTAFEIDGPSGSIVPEPSSFLLLATALAGLAGMVKRKLRG